jgi:hypothetical protein
VRCEAVDARLALIIELRLLFCQTLANCISSSPPELPKTRS